MVERARKTVNMADPAPIQLTAPVQFTFHLKCIRCNAVLAQGALSGLQLKSSPLDNIMQLVNTVLTEHLETCK